MSLTILHEPDPVCTSRNLQAFKIQTDQGANKEIHMKMWIETHHQRGNFQHVIETFHPADSSGKSEFYIHEYLNDALDYDLPDLIKPKNALQTCKRYICMFSDASAITDPFDVSLAKYAVKAGFDFHIFPQRSTLLPQGRKHLSLKPVERLVTRKQKEWLYLFPEDNQDITLDFRITYTDDFTHPLQKTCSDVEPYRPKIIPVDFVINQYERFFPDKKIYSVSIKWAGTELVLLKLFDNPERY